MILNFQNVTNLQESWQRLLPVVELLLQQQAYINSKLIKQIQTVQRILFEQVTTKRIMPHIQTKKQVLQMGFLNRQIQTVLQQNLKKIELIGEESAPQSKQPTQKKKIVQPLNAVTKIPPQRPLIPLIPPRKYKIPVLTVKRQIPQPPQRIRQGKFAPKMRVSIESPNPNRRASRSKQERFVLAQPQTEKPKVEQARLEKLRKQQKASTEKAFTEKASTEKASTEKASTEKACTQKAQIRKALQFIKPKILKTELKNQRQLSLLNYNREQLGYAKSQSQSRLHFLGSLNSHFNSLRRQALPSPHYSPQVHRIATIRFCLEKATQDKGSQVQRYYACQLIHRELQGVVGSEQQVQQEQKERLMRVQIEGQQLRAVWRDFQINKINIEKRYQEYRLILIKFFVNRGLRKKTQTHNQCHLQGLKSIIQIGLLKGRSRLTFIPSDLLRQFFK